MSDATHSPSDPARRGIAILKAAAGWFGTQSDVDLGFGHLGRVMVISPHLDDAVFSCGDLIANHPGAVVVTVFAGSPPRWEQQTEWDAAAGFDPGVDAIAVRRDEDRHALGMLAADPLWLPFRDAQYGNSPGIEEVAGALERTIEEQEADSVFLPLGLWHSDHRLVHAAAMLVRDRFEDVSWFIYADAIYRAFARGNLADRIAELKLGEPRVSPFRASGLKRRALACYSSQLRALTTPGKPGWLDAMEPEQYWKLKTTDSTEKHGETRI